MKIRVAEKSYEEVIAMETAKHRKPKKPNVLFRTLLKIVSTPDLLATKFTCREIGMEKLGKHEPCLYLMNHSSFIDLKIASSILYPRPFNIVCTSDGFVGKNWLMRQLGCIPTKKFVADLTSVRDMIYAVRKLQSSILMYPEASYSFDGTPTPLPETLGPFLKMLGAPVVMIRTYGAFSRDPLYNNLRRRKVKVSAEMEYILSPEEIRRKSPSELNAILKERFTFDHFRWQQENEVKISEDFRAEGLERVLYQCPHCLAEGEMHGEDSVVTCRRCGVQYTLDEYGRLSASDAETKFAHIPDWYAWERECVRREINEGSYRMEAPVDIYMLVDTKRVYRVGEGTLYHDKDGFRLEGCNGKLAYSQKPIASYSLYSDFYWYEIGDVICIGDTQALYYCFPKTNISVAKARIATEELYQLAKAEKDKKKMQK